MSRPRARPWSADGGEPVRSGLYAADGDIGRPRKAGPNVDLRLG